MHQIGEKVVYPMHGAGIIEGIEEQHILDEMRRYYVFSAPYGSMKIMIPVDNSGEIGVRPIMDKDMLPGVMAVLSEDSSEMPPNWNRRNRENLAKLKSGEPCQVAEVFRNLQRWEREKKLSAGEKDILSKARHILLSELVLVTGDTLETVERTVMEKIFEKE